MTGSTLGELLSLPDEELLAMRHMIGAWNREKEGQARSATKGQGPSGFK